MSSMMDLMNQGAPPDPNAPYGGGAPGGGDPMSALMGAAPPDPNAPPPDPGAGGPPLTPPGPGDGSEGTEAASGDETSDYQDALNSLQSAMGRATTDAIEKAQIAKCISAIQDLLSNNQKSMDSALGTSPQLRKALAGGGGPPQ